MKNFKLNGVITYAPKSRDELIDYAVDSKSILVAVNAEKIFQCNINSQVNPKFLTEI